MSTVYVKPSEGGRIRQPERNNRVMPAAGALVLRDSYYERLILTGDVIETDEPPKTSSEKTSSEKPSPDTSSPDPKPAPALQLPSAAPSTKD